jgi:hypothetical protein
MPEPPSFADLSTLARHLRSELETKRFVLIYAYNGTGKTRLCTEFKDQGKTRDENGEPTGQDTLYFNAFTEDLFTWDNDLENDQERVLKLNRASRFFAGLKELEMDTRVREQLDRYADFDFRIDTENWQVSFSRKEGDTVVDGIKVSRGEENLFIWCFFLAVLQLVLDRAEAYGWVKYVYIDDPISSLDEQNAVAVAVHLAAILKGQEDGPKTVISTHHPLFFNVLFNEFRREKGSRQFFLGRSASRSSYTLRNTGATPFFHHVANLVELHQAAQTGEVFTHHFNALRALAEKTASFLGYTSFGDCICCEDGDEDGVLHTRFLNLLSHGSYSLYEPREMLPENKEHFRKMLCGLTKRFHFNPDLFPSED